MNDRRDAVAREVRPDENLTARFSAAATTAGCRMVVTTRAECGAALLVIINELKIRSLLVCADATPWLPPAVLDEVAAAGVSISTELDDDTLFAVDAALTGAAAAVAETGTLICTSGPAAARGATLIPPTHIALVPASRLLADLCDAFDRLAAEPELPAAVNLITGPSKTADIEGVLVTGVHGPGVVCVLLLTDA